MTDQELEAIEADARRTYPPRWVAMLALVAEVRRLRDELLEVKASVSCWTRRALDAEARAHALETAQRQPSR